MALTVSNRPLVSATKAAAAAKPAVATKPVASAPSFNPLVSAAHAVEQVAPSTVLNTVATGLNVGRLAFTPPLIWDIIKEGVKGGFGLTNLVWFVVPSSIRNARDIVNHKESIARGVGNVTSDATIGIGKGIAAGVVVQCLQVAVAPFLALLPEAALPFAGLALGLGGLVGAYWVLGKIIKGTGADKLLSNGITKLLGGDLKTPAPTQA